LWEASLDLDWALKKDFEKVVGLLVTSMDLVLAVSKASHSEMEMASMRGWKLELWWWDIS